MARETPPVAEGDKHLLPGFDPAKVTIPVLRGLLLEHNVDFASNARKADLVALFKNHVQPRAADILRERLAVEASDQGIRRITQQSSSDSDSDQQISVPAKRRSKEAQTPATAKKQKPEEDQDPKEEFKRRKARRTSGFSDINAFQNSSPEQEEKKKKKKARKSSATPMEIDDPEPVYEPPSEPGPTLILQPKPSLLSVDSPRTKPRVSSPLKPVASTSQTPAESPIPRSQSAPRLKTYVNTRAIVGPSEEFKALKRQAEEKERQRQAALEAPKVQPSPPVKHESPRRRSNIGAQTETPKKEARKSLPAKSPLVRVGASDSTPPSPLRKALVVAKKKVNPSLIDSYAAKTATWVSFTIFCLVYLLWWRSERLALGYCDPNSNTNTLLDARHVHAAPDDAQALSSPNTAALSRLVNALRIRPSCMACPAHGWCTQGELNACDKDYVRQPNPFSALVGSLIPLPDRCVPDTEKLVRVAEIASQLEKRLRQERGRIICSGPLSGVTELSREVVSTDEARKFGMRVEQAKVALLPHRNTKLAPSTWEDYFAHAVADLVAHGEAIREAENDEVWIAATQADLPLWCRSQRMAYEYASQRKSELSILFTTLLGLWWIQAAIKQHQAERARVKELANLALRALRDQKRHYAQAKMQGRSDVDPYWSQTGMRDHILSTEHNLAVRQRLWKQVSKLVENNDNVRLYEIELDGQPGVRVWDWAGNVEQTFAFDVTPGKQTRFEVAKVYPTLE